VFLLDVLRPYIEPLLVGRKSEEFVFGSEHDTPFDARAVSRRMERTWNAADAKRAVQELPPLERYTLHGA
jgi:hypothetical protein